MPVGNWSIGCELFCGPTCVPSELGRRAIIDDIFFLEEMVERGNLEQEVRSDALRRLGRLSTSSGL
ncbi:MAG: hypothetical protein ABSG92_06305 [Conexivisphaerales archaeon]|jgi:hypothetical protein